jgi:hypothetical protein
LRSFGSGIRAAASHPQEGRRSNFPIFLVLLGELGEGLQGDVQGLGDAAHVAPSGIAFAALDFGNEGGGEVGSLGEGSLGELRFLAKLLDRSGQTFLAFGWWGAARHRPRVFRV